MDITSVILGLVLGLGTVLLGFFIYGMESVNFRILLIFVFVLLVIVEIIPVLYAFGGTLGDFVILPDIVNNLSTNLTDYLLGLGCGAAGAALFSRMM